MSSFNYYPTHICNLKVIAAPLYFLLKQEEFVWNKFYEKVYNNVKTLFKCALQLVMPKPTDNLLIVSDASKISLSYAICKVETDLSLSIVQMDSKLLNSADRNKLILEKEVLPISYVLMNCEQLIRNNKNPVLFLSDMLSVCWLQKLKETKSSLLNISLFVSSFDNLEFHTCQGDLIF